MSDDEINPSRDYEPPPEAPERSSRFTLALSTLFFFAMTLGCLISEYGLVERFLLARSSVSWPMVKGVVQKSQLVDIVGQPGKKRLDFQYRYEIAGKSYESSEIHWDGVPYNEYDSKVAQYPPEAEVTVRYNPGDPSVSILEPGTTKLSYFLIIMPLFVTAFFAWFFFQLLLASLRQAPQSSMKSPGAA